MKNRLFVVIENSHNEAVLPLACTVVSPFLLSILLCLLHSDRRVRNFFSISHSTVSFRLRQSSNDLDFLPTSRTQCRVCRSPSTGFNTWRLIKAKWSSNCSPNMACPVVSLVDSFLTLSFLTRMEWTRNFEKAKNY